MKTNRVFVYLRLLLLFRRAECGLYCEIRPRAINYKFKAAFSIVFAKSLSKRE